MKLTKSTLKQIIKEELGKITEAAGIGHEAEKVTGIANTVLNAGITQRVLGDLREVAAGFTDALPRMQFLAKILETLGYSEGEVAAASMRFGKKTIEEVPPTETEEDEEGGELGTMLPPATAQSVERSRRIARGVE